MEISNLGLNSSSFNFSLGHLGRNSSRANPNPIPITSFLKIVSELGFNGVEFPFFRFCQSKAKNINEINNILKKNNLFCILDCGLPINDQEIKNLIPVAKYLGTDLIRIKVTNILCCNRQRIKMDWDEFIKKIIYKINKLLPLLKEFQIKLAIENHQDVDSFDLYKIIDNTDSEYIGVNFDVGNAIATLEHPIDFAKRMSENIMLINLKDYKIKRSKSGFRLIQCPFGDGVVFTQDLSNFFKQNFSSLKHILEIGALSSRNIKIETDKFWKNFRNTSEQEKNNFYDFINQNQIKAKTRWKTPWENDSSSQKIILHEMQQVKKSIENLKDY